MKTNMSEILNAAIDQWDEQECIPDILQSHPDQAQELFSLLETVDVLKSVDAVEMPSDKAMQSDRNVFLQKIAQSEKSTVSPGVLARIKEWSGSLIRWPQISLPYLQKEKWNMSAVLARVVLVFGLLFGATGGAYAMADNSLPNEPMYGAKLAMEQFQLGLVSDPAKVASQNLTMAQNRAQEIVRLAQKGTSPDAGTMTRLETHLNAALQLAAQLGNDGAMLGVLTRAQTMAQEQAQTMSRIQATGNASVQEPLQLLNQFQNRVEAGLQDPQAFRWQYQNGQVPSALGQNSDCPSGDCVPVGDENKYGQTDEGAPSQPGGNPDCTLNDCVPVGDENQYGQTDEVAPGQPGGNPDCTLNDCVPVGDENHYGQTDEVAPGQPGGNPDCTCDDCVPDGDANQYGQTDESAPGQPGGNPDCPSNDCVPVGDQNGPNRP